MQLQDPVLLGLVLVAAAPQLVMPAQEPLLMPQRVAIVDLEVHLLLGPEQHLLAVLVIEFHSIEINSAVVEDSIDFVATLRTDLEWSTGSRLLVLQGTRRASLGRYHCL